MTNNTTTTKTSLKEKINAKREARAAAKAAKQAEFDALPLDEQELIKSERAARGALIALTAAVGVCAAATAGAVIVAAVRDDGSVDGSNCDAGAGAAAGESLGFSSCDSYGFI
jgi:hypothetical protein